MDEKEFIRRQIDIAFGEIQYLIRLLYTVTDYNTRNLVLNQLWNQVSLLQLLMNLLDQAPTVTAAMPPLPQPAQRALPSLPAMAGQGPAQALPTFTSAQLATYTGRNGSPAYVAVNGIVYDVTNNKAWSAASHFGLPAGKDLTPEFASCHAGQQGILSTLRPVGRLT